MVNVNPDVIRNYALSVETENRELKGKIIKMEDKIESMQDEIDYYKRLLSEKDDYIKSLESEHDKFLEEYLVKMNEMDTVLNDYHDRVKNFQLKKAKSNRMINELDKALKKQLENINKNSLLITKDES